MLSRQKLNKAPGVDNTYCISVDLLRTSDKEGIIALHWIVSKVWTEGKLPEDGKSAIIYKKGIN
ncbi:hypothetical protein C0J52_11234 [Blattella germanica]|nr:hypothetical protein C0J52_11234 [Blattella germanica]